MPTYYDPILLETSEIENTTILYLIKLNNLYYLKAISSGIDNLHADPTTRATHYWRLDSSELLSKKLENKVIFSDGRLSTAGLTTEQVKDNLDLDLEKEAPTSFDPDIRRQLANRGANNVAHRANNIVFFQSQGNNLLNNNGNNVNRALFFAVLQSNQESQLEDAAEQLRNDLDVVRAAIRGFSRY